MEEPLLSDATVSSREGEPPIEVEEVDDIPMDALGASPNLESYGMIIDMDPSYLEDPLGLNKLITSKPVYQPVLSEMYKNGAEDHREVVSDVDGFSKEPTKETLEEMRRVFPPLIGDSESEGDEGTFSEEEDISINNSSPSKKATECVKVVDTETRNSGSPSKDFDTDNERSTMKDKRVVEEYVPLVGSKRASVPTYEPTPIKRRHVPVITIPQPSDDPTPPYQAPHEEGINCPSRLFQGAPSLYSDAPQAAIMREFRDRALATGDCNVRVVPRNVLCIERNENARGADGSNYEVTSYWIEHPRFKSSKTVGTQYEDPTKGEDQANSKSTQYEDPTDGKGPYLATDPVMDSKDKVKPTKETEPEGGVKFFSLFKKSFM